LQEIYYILSGSGIVFVQYVQVLSCMWHTLQFVPLFPPWSVLAFVW